MRRDDRAQQAAESVIDELLSRSGFDHWWARIDEDTQDTIVTELARTISATYESD